MEEGRHLNSPADCYTVLTKAEEERLGKDISFLVLPSSCTLENNCCPGIEKSLHLSLH